MYIKIKNIHYQHNILDVVYIPIHPSMDTFFANKYCRISLERICTIRLRVKGLRDNMLQLSQFNILSNRLITHSEQKCLKQSTHCF